MRSKSGSQFFHRIGPGNLVEADSQLLVIPIVTRIKIYCSGVAKIFLRRVGWDGITRPP